MEPGPSATPIGLIILAAGASTRMGQPKQLLAYEGESLIRRSVRFGLLSGCFPVVVVVGANSALIAVEIEDLPVFVVQNLDWQEGMGSSIRAGLVELLQVMPAVKGALITLCDQPLVTPDFLHELTELFKQGEKPIIATQYNHITGVPALFSHALFHELASLSGQEGARKLIQAHPDELTRVPFPKAATDIDTPEDYLNLIGDQEQE